MCKRIVRFELFVKQLLQIPHIHKNRTFKKFYCKEIDRMRLAYQSILWQGHVKNIHFFYFRLLCVVINKVFESPFNVSFPSRTPEYKHSSM